MENSENTTQTNPCSTSSTSPGSTKLAANPQVVLADPEDELKKRLESIVSGSKQTLILSQDEMPNPQLSRTVSSPHCLSTSIPQEINDEAANTYKESVPLVPLSQQTLCTMAPYKRWMAKIKKLAPLIKRLLVLALLPQYPDQQLRQLPK